MTPRRFGVLIVALALAVTAAGASAQAPAAPTEAKPTEAPAAAAAPADPLKDLTAKVADAKVAVDTVWVMVAACLVFFMNLGFAGPASSTPRT
jgi:hypothetical protein